MKFVVLDEDLYRYVAAHRSSPRDPVLDDLRAATEKLDLAGGRPGRTLRC